MGSSSLKTVANKHIQRRTDSAAYHNKHWCRAFSGINIISMTLNDFKSPEKITKIPIGAQIGVLVIFLRFSAAAHTLKVNRNENR